MKKKKADYRQATDSKLPTPPTSKDTEWVITFGDTTVVERAQTAHQAWISASKKGQVPPFAACKVVLR